MAYNRLIMEVNQAQNVPIIIGNTSSFDISIKNISIDQRVYNLSMSLTLPDGMSLYTADIPQTSSVVHGDYSTTYTWVNIKDLAPMEVSFKLGITVQCKTQFNHGGTIPFGYHFVGVRVGAQVDTMPRGSYDIGNEVVEEQVMMSYETVRFASRMATADKVLKGAGTSVALTDYTQVYTATCQFVNNAVSTSVVNIRILLEDGIRYIGNLIVEGRDGLKFLNPTISVVRIEEKIYTQLYYGNVTLSINSMTMLTFSYAVWNRYNNNQAEYIFHGTKLNMLIDIVSADPLIDASASSDMSFLAMDVIITTGISQFIIDVEMPITYTYVYKVGQYNQIDQVKVKYKIPDGIVYLASSTLPVEVIDDPVIEGYLITYDLPLAIQNSMHTITISAQVEKDYRYKLDVEHVKLPVVAADSFVAEVDIIGDLVESRMAVQDGATVGAQIGIGNMTKTFIKGYYRDGTPKSIRSLAPLDLAEYRLTYDASFLKAIQKQVYIADFFPLSANPIEQLTYDYTGMMPLVEPQLISPHGVEFKYGDLLGNTSCTIYFKVPIASLGEAPQNINLMKLKGINTYGNAYSNRAQVMMNIGSPNLSLIKTVSGPNKTAIQVNEVYTYTVTISNANTLGTETDAFDFTLSDSLATTWFSLVEGSIQVSGTGSYKTPRIEGNAIILYINQLAPGTALTLTYKVRISQVLAPGVSVTTTATFTNPYAQVYDDALVNFRYMDLSKSVSVTLSSKAINVSKTYRQGEFKVGSVITYLLNVTIPKGTIAYGLYIKDILPSGGQVYIEPAYKNGIQVIPTINSNVITLPVESVVDARQEAYTIVYILNAQISQANKAMSSLTSSQTNTMQCLYQQVEGGSLTTINKNVSVTINHPNLAMYLSVVDQTTSISYTSTVNITTSSILQFKLILQNNSKVSLMNGVVELVVDSHFLFVSIDTQVLCTASYNEATRKILINIQQLPSGAYGYFVFTVLPQATLSVGTTMQMQATAIAYYNDVSKTKVYSGEKSNRIDCVLAPGVSLKPNPLYQINETTSFNVTAPGHTVMILDYFKNIGGGFDDFTLMIQKSEIAYSLYIDDVKEADVEANKLYQVDLESMRHLAPGEEKVIKIIATIPLYQGLGRRYDFIVTVKSKTSPYPERTVLNIDPCPF